MATSMRTLTDLAEHLIYSMRVMPQPNRAETWDRLFELIFNDFLLYHNVFLWEPEPDESRDREIWRLSPKDTFAMPDGYWKYRTGQCTHILLRPRDVGHYGFVVPSVPVFGVSPLADGRTAVEWVEPKGV